MTLKFIKIIFLFFALNTLSQAERKVSIAKQGMVVTEQAIASQVGVDILKQGGNAVDAAVAVGYALAVVNPCCGNLGGSGFMTLHLANKQTVFINFRSRAPMLATATMFQDESGKVMPDKSLYSYSAVAVPGTVLGLETARKKYGTMTRQKLIAPAIKLAKQGFKLSAGDVSILQSHHKILSQAPNVAEIFLKGNRPYQVGDRLVQKDLSHTLQQISTLGTPAFYQGPIAKAFVKESQAHGGLIRLRDLKDYTVEITKPIECHYHDLTIYSAPPPSSGGVALCEILNILQPLPLKKLGFHSVGATHYIVEAMRYAFQDRNNKIGDPDFVDNPIAQLTSLTYADKLRNHIIKGFPFPAELSKFTKENIHTTHYSIIDKQGNAVAVTYTLNSLFGSGLIAGHTGFLLNNDMDDFTAKPGSANQFGLVQGVANAIAPGKRPLSAMTPTIIVKNGKVIMVVGSPGGPRIITSVLQTILNVFEFGFDVQQAVDAPRFHHQCLPNIVYSEAGAFSAATEKTLSKNGYHLSIQKPWSAVEAIYIDPQTHLIFGGSDSRRSAGKAIGY